MSTGFSDGSTRFLRHGDLIALELPNLDGCENGGLLGSELIDATSKRLIADTDIEVVNHSTAAILPNSVFGDSARLPHPQYLMCAIFQIAAGVGYEAAGEPVNYGTQVRIILRRSGEYLRARKESNTLDFFPREEDAKEESKAYNFKIGPRYLVRKEGDRIMYNDIFILTDYLGRSVFCASTNKIILSENKAERTGFRLLSFVPYNEDHGDAVLSGDFVQLYHVEDHAFLSACQRYSSVSSSSKGTGGGTSGSIHMRPSHPNNNHDDTASSGSGGGTGGVGGERDSRGMLASPESARFDPSGAGVVGVGNSPLLMSMHVEPVFRELVSFERGCGFFQIETIARNVTRLHGIITSTTAVRFRHLLYDKYLILDSGDDRSGASGTAGGSGVRHNGPAIMTLAPSNPAGGVDPSSIFEMHSISGLRQDVDSNTVTSTTSAIQRGSNVRLYHRASRSYITLVEVSDSMRQTNVTKFGNSQSEFDKDVYMVLPAEVASIENVIVGKKFLHALQTLSLKLHMRDLAAIDKQTFMKKIKTILDLLTVQSSFLSDIDPDGDGPLQSMFFFSQHVANEMGYVHLLLELCRIAYSTGRKLVQRVEEELTETAYTILGLLLRRNRAVARSVLDLRGVPLMLSHLTKNRSRGTKWSPPLLQLVDASYASSYDGGDAPIQVFSDVDIKFLLDEVAGMLSKGKPPMKFYYQILSRLCRPPEKNIRQFDREHHSDKVQDMICEQVLGTPEPPDCHTRSPLMSLMVYRSRIVEREVEIPVAVHDQQQQDDGDVLDASLNNGRGRARNSPRRSPRFGWGIQTTLLAANAGAGKTDPAGLNKPSPLPPRTIRRIEKRILVCTSPYGQVRPPTRHENFLPVRPPTVPREACGDDDWVEAMQLMHTEESMLSSLQHFSLNPIPALSPRSAQAGTPAAGHSAVSSAFADTNGSGEGGSSSSEVALLVSDRHRRLRSRYSSVINAVEGASQWKDMSDLSSDEEEFYCATLDLLSAMCHGRNVWAQRVVRKLIPVDHILFALDRVNAKIAEEESARAAGEAALPSTTTATATKAHGEAGRHMLGGVGGEMLGRLMIPGLSLPTDMPNLPFGLGSKHGNSRHPAAGQIDLAKKRDPLRAIRSSLLNVLLDCYIDSGMLPHLPSSGLSNLVQSGKVASSLSVWKDLYSDECHSKVFSMISQTDENLIEVSQFMDNGDIKNSLRYIVASVTYRQLNSGQILPYEDIIRSWLSNPDVTESPHVYEFLKQQRTLRQLQFAELNFKSCLQRAQLHALMDNFLRHEALPLWEFGVEHPLLELTSPSAAGAAVGRISEGGLTTGMKSGNIGTPLSGGKSPNMSSFTSKFRRPRSPSVGTGTPREVIEIRDRIQYVMNMLNVLRALLLRGFFEPEYNTNPLYLSHTRPTPGDSNGRTTSGGGLGSRRSISFGNVLSQNDREFGGASGDSGSDFGRAKSQGGNDITGAFSHGQTVIHESYFYSSELPSDEYAVRNIRSSSGKMISIVNMNKNATDDGYRTYAFGHKKKGPHFHGGMGLLGGGGGVGAVGVGGGTGGKQQSSKEEAAASNDIHRALMNAIAMNDGDEVAMRPVHDIIQFVLEIIHVAPHKRLNPDWMLNEDDRLLEEYFRTQFGFISDPYSLVSKVIEVKLLCCKILNICLERIQSKTYETLWEIFSPAFEKLKKKKSNELRSANAEIVSDSYGMSGSLKSIVGKFALKRRVLKKLMVLSDTEAETFRDDVYDDLIKIVKRSTDLIWHENDLFTDRAYRTLMHLAYYNSADLRAECLNLVYHVNARRAQLAGAVLKQFSEYRLEDTMAISFLSRQRSALIQLLGKFRIEMPEDENWDAALSASASPAATGSGRCSTFRENSFRSKKEAMGVRVNTEGGFSERNRREGDQEGSSSSAQYNMRRMVARLENIKLIKIFLNTDVDEPLGFVNFMFSLTVERLTDEDTAGRGESRRRSDKDRRKRGVNFQSVVASNSASHRSSVRRMSLLGRGSGRGGGRWEGEGSGSEHERDERDMSAKSGRSMGSSNSASLGGGRAKELIKRRSSLIGISRRFSAIQFGGPSGSKGGGEHSYESVEAAAAAAASAMNRGEGGVSERRGSTRSEQQEGIRSLVHSGNDSESAKYAEQMQDMDDMYDALQKRHLTNARHQNLVMNFDVHKIVLRFLNRNCETFIQHCDLLRSVRARPATMGSANAHSPSNFRTRADSDLGRTDRNGGRSVDGATESDLKIDTARIGESGASGLAETYHSDEDTDAISPSVMPHEHKEYEVVFANCFLFLRALVKNNKSTSEALSTAASVSLIFQLRHYCVEAIELLKDLVKNFPGIMAYIGEKEFGFLLDDVSFVVAHAGSSDRQLPRHGVNIASTIRILSLINTIVTCRTDSSVNRMNQLLSFMNRRIDPVSALPPASGASASSPTNAVGGIKSGVEDRNLAGVGSSTSNSAAGVTSDDPRDATSPSAVHHQNASNHKIQLQSSHSDGLLHGKAGKGGGGGGKHRHGHNGSNKKKEISLIGKILQSALGAEEVSEVAAFDVKYICREYCRATSRVTFTRLPKDILADQPISEALYRKIKLMLNVWPLLPQDSLLRFHLHFIALLADSARTDPQVRKMCRSLFSSPKHLWEIFLIDKHEIRAAYLKLLLGVWFFDAQTTSFPVELMPQPIHEYIRALFYSFSQDVKVFAFASPEYFLLHPTAEQGMRNQIDMLRDYIVESMLPFLHASLRTNLLEEVDGSQATAATRMMNLSAARAAVQDTHSPLSSPETDHNIRSANSSRTSLHHYQLTLYEINRDIALSLADIVHEAESFYYLLSAENAAENLVSVLEIVRRSYTKVFSKEQIQRVMDAIRSLNKALIRDGRATRAGAIAHRGVSTSSLLRKRNPALGGGGSCNAEAFTLAEGLESVKTCCIQEFLILVDTYGGKYGTKQQHLELIKIPRLYVHDEEVEVSARASLPLLSKIDAILNPLNTKEFVYTTREISKLVLGYASVTFDSRFHSLINRMINNEFNYEMAIFDPAKQRRMEWASKEPSAHTSSTSSNMGALSGIGVGTTTHNSGSGGMSSDGYFNYLYSEEVKEYSRLQFLRWNQHGGRLLQLIIENVMHSVACYQKQSGVERLQLPMTEITKCSAYWVDLITKGLLRSRMKDLDVFYADQTEMQMEQLQFETERLALMQETMMELRASDLVVHSVTVSQESLGGNYNLASYRLIQSMSIGMGIALLENGNTVLQNSMIDTIRYGSIGGGSGGGAGSGSISGSSNNSSKSLSLRFMTSIRSMLRRFDRLFVLEDKLDESSKREAERLMRFLVLFCEGHNYYVQSYFGRINVVSEVASFCAEISRILAREMQAALITDDVLNAKYHPKVYGTYRRQLIRWVTRDSSDSRVFIRIEKISLLAQVVQAVLEALSEFIQGPCVENQLIIARAGSIVEFSTFFRFFGAYQLVLRERQLVALQNQLMDKQWLKVYMDKVQAVSTHEGSVQFHDIFHPSWVGNDPIALDLLIKRQMKDPSSFIKPKYVLGDLRNTLYVACCGCLFSPSDKDDGEGGEDESRKGGPQMFDASSFQGGGSGSVTPLLRGTSAFFNNITSGGDARIDPEDPSSTAIYTGAYFLQQKAKFRALQGVPDETEDQAEQREANIYHRINKFGETLAILEASCLKLAGSLLEGAKQDEELLEIPRTVFHAIGEENLISNMANYWERYLHYVPIASSKAPAAQDCFERQMSYDYYCLVMRICDIPFAADFKVKVQDFVFTRKIPIEEHIARIEIRSHDSTSLEVAYFPIPSIIKRFWSRPDVHNMRENILYPPNGVGGGRDSAEEKVKSFIKDGMELIAALRHLDSLDDSAAKNPIRLLILTFARHFNRWSLLSFLLSITINVLLLCSVFSDEDGVGYIIRGELYSFLIRNLGLCHLCVTSVTALSYTAMYGFLYVKNRQKENPQNTVTISGAWSARFAKFLNWFYMLGKDRGVLLNNTLTVHMWGVTMATYFFFENMESNYYYMLIALSVIGNFGHPIAFAFCLVEFFRTFKLMFYVTKAFTQNIDQVIATVVLSALLMYIFTVVSFYNPVLHNEYNFNEQGIDGCFTLHECFRLHLDYSFLQSVFWNYDGEIETVEGEIFNFLLVFILQIVLPGLVSGIIIDTFSQLREEKLALEEDVANTCFICNINREDFETANVSFTQHIREEHNCWMYLWYIIYLSEKDPTEYDGVEQFCAEQVAVDNTPRMLPMKMARALSSVRDKYDLFTIYSKISGLTQNVQKIDASLKADLEDHAKAVRDGSKTDVNAMQNTIRSQLLGFERKLLKKIKRDAAILAAAAKKAGKREEGAGGGADDADIDGGVGAGAGDGRGADSKVPAGDNAGVGGGGGGDRHPEADEGVDLSGEHEDTGTEPPGTPIAGN